MNITFFSFFMALIWSSLLIFLFYIGLKKRKFIRYFGVTSLVVVYLVCAVRLLVSLEFPFVKVVGIRGAFANLYATICLKKYTFFSLDTSIAWLLSGIWLIGSVILITRWIIQYRKAINKICMLKKYRHKNVEKILCKIQRKYNHKHKVEIWQSPSVDVPMGIGFIRKTILLPEYDYTESELYFILLHEYTHFINHDITVKLLIHIFCCIFWWNPCVYLLKDDLDQILELKCDLSVTEYMDKNEKASYLEVLIEMFTNLEEKGKKKYSITSFTLFQTKSETAMKERFQVIIDQHVRKKTMRMYYYLWMALLCGSISFSYFFQFQAEFSPPLSTEEEMTPESTYILDNGDGTYTLVDLQERGNENKMVIHKKEIVENMILEGFVLKNR